VSAYISIFRSNLFLISDLKPLPETTDPMEKVLLISTSTFLISFHSNLAKEPRAEISTHPQWHLPFYE
jgi:hypothetical protein